MRRSEVSFSDLCPILALLNVRRVLAFMGFSDEQVAQMYGTGNSVRAKGKVFSSMYRH